MATLSTNLKTWGSVGSEYPDNYSYLEGEQPVDEWDNYVNSNLISDIQDILDAFNNSVLQTDGSNSVNSGATGIPYVQDAGAEILADMPVSSTPTAGSEMSQTIAIDGVGILKVYAEADGTGGLQNISVESSGPTTFEDLLDMSPIAEPAAPSGSDVRLFVDSADNDLKAKDPAGDVVTIVTT